MRTIGDPDIRFREDPVRILRAVKFAARCDLTIEPETYRRMMEHRQEIAKCAQARVSEEFYRLLRAGAAKRSMELLLETELLEILAPEIARGLKGEPDGEETALRRARLWGYLGRARSIDRAAPRAAVERAAPGGAGAAAAARRAGSRQQRRARRRAAGRAGDRAGARAAAPVAPRQRDGAADPAGPALHPALQERRAAKAPAPAARVRRRGAAPGGDRLRRRGASTRRLAGRPIIAEGTPLGERRPISRPRSKTSRPPEIEPLDGTTDRRRDAAAAAAAESAAAAAAAATRRPWRHGAAPPRPRHRAAGCRRARPPLATDLGSLATAARSLVAPLRPAFLGTGAFGGPWDRAGLALRSLGFRRGGRGLPDRSELGPVGRRRPAGTGAAGVPAADPRATRRPAQLRRTARHPASSERLLRYRVRSDSRSVRRPRPSTAALLFTPTIKRCGDGLPVPPQMNAERPQ